MSNVSFLRHSGWVSPQDLTETLNIIGCGAVGSNLALLAAKMGVHRFRLWDVDEVEPHNLPNQAFEPEHVGQKKVEALAAVLRRFNPEIEVEIHTSFFTIDNKDQLDGPLVIATDTMKSRKEIYNAFYLNPNVSHVFEIRLGFDYGELHVIDNLDPDACDRWNRMLVNDEDVPEGPCNQRICTTLVLLISSYAVHTLCAKYVAESAGETWEPKSRTMFELKPELQIYAL